MSLNKTTSAPISRLPRVSSSPFSYFTLTKNIFQMLLQFFIKCSAIAEHLRNRKIYSENFVLYCIFVIECFLVKLVEKLQHKKEYIYYKKISKKLILVILYVGEFSFSPYNSNLYTRCSVPSFVGILLPYLQRKEHQ